jgi:hypothetical protein
MQISVFVFNFSCTYNFIHFCSISIRNHLEMERSGMPFQLINAEMVRFLDLQNASGRGGEGSVLFVELFGKGSLICIVCSFNDARCLTYTCNDSQQFEVYSCSSMEDNASVAFVALPMLRLVVADLNSWQTRASCDRLLSV